MPDVARFYGLQINRSGMACCPFHEERTPSLKVYNDHVVLDGKVLGETNTTYTVEQKRKKGA